MTEARAASSIEQHRTLIQSIQEKLSKQFKIICGSDTWGNEYESIEEMWCQERILVKPTETTAATDNSIGSASPTLRLQSNDQVGRREWYAKSLDYWQNESNAPATIDGMLGGFAVLSDRDLTFSRNFMHELFHNECQELGSRISRQQKSAPDVACCECGAGIGRVSKGLLLPLGT